MTNAWEPFGAAAAKRGGSIVISDTATGYAVQQNSKRFDFDACLELVLRFSGLAMLVVAGGQWFLPMALPGSEAVPAKLGFSVVLAITGFVFSWLGARGLKTQMQVDVSDRRIRLVYVNGRGNTRPQKTLTMRDIESFYVKRTKNPLEPATLYLRLRGGGQQRVAVGSEDELSALHERMCGELKPVRRRLAKRSMQEAAGASLFKAA